jgi:hypothetical protein
VGGQKASGGRHRKGGDRILVVVKDGRSDVSNGKLPLRSAVLPSGAGHFMDHRVGFVLRKRRGALFAEMKETFGAVLAHPGPHAGGGEMCGSALDREFRKQTHGRPLLPHLGAFGPANCGGIDGGAHHFDFGIVAEGYGHEFSDDGGVVHDEHTSAAGDHGRGRF